jgi:glutamate racemase
MIALFDSGYGGLTVLKGLLKKLPQYDYLYLGDSARVPYGGRSQEVIQQFTEEGVQFFIEKKVPLLIIACNTATAAALPYLQKKYSDKIKILGVVRPLVEYAVNHSKKKKIGVVATRATVNMHAYTKEIQKLAPDLTVREKACPLLVPLIEEGWSKKPETKMILRKYLHPLKNEHIDTLILACTHYPVLFKEFQKMMGRKIRVVNSGEVIAESLADYLHRHPEIEKKLTKNATRNFLTTDREDRFYDFTKIFLGIALEKNAVKQVKI